MRTASPDISVVDLKDRISSASKRTHVRDGDRQLTIGRNVLREICVLRRDTDKGEALMVTKNEDKIILLKEKDLGCRHHYGCRNGRR